MKKFLSIILALALLTGIAGTTAFAEEDIDETDDITGEIAFDTTGLLGAYASSLLSAYQKTDRFDKLFGDEGDADEAIPAQLKELLTMVLLSQFEEADAEEYSENDDVLTSAVIAAAEKALSDKEDSSDFSEYLKALPEESDKDLVKLIDDNIEELKKKDPEKFAELSDEVIGTIKNLYALMVTAFNEDYSEDEDTEEDELSEAQLELIDFLSILVLASND